VSLKFRARSAEEARGGVLDRSGDTRYPRCGVGMSSSGVGAPTIAASAVAGVRHLLIEENVWADVRAELVRTHADAASWIDSDLSVDPTKTRWVPVEHHAQMMDALFAVAGAARTFDLGRARGVRTGQAGAFAPVVRSWSRSFGANPAEFLKLTLHAWSSQTQNLGEFVLAEARPGHVRFVMKDATRLLTESPGWQLFLAGYGTGLLDLVKREGRCDIHRAGPDIECIYTYDSAPLR